MNLAPNHIQFGDWLGQKITEIAVLSVEAGVTVQEQREAKALRVALEDALAAPHARPEESPRSPGAHSPIRLVAGRDVA